VVRLLPEDASGTCQGSSGQPLGRSTRRIHDQAGHAVAKRRAVGYLGYRGARVVQVEHVIVNPAFRGKGIGEAMMRSAIAHARERGCYRIQLTSNKARTRAHRFYARRGFAASHEGFKIALD
jgi:GNAT superfamily N-acetyltransferase